jgi:biopolymer transport protein ExbB/biopolymer transport protein TolQ
MHFTPQALWAATGTPVRVVLIVLMAMAVWCFYVAIERAFTLAKARKQSRLLAGEVAGPLSKSDAAGALKACQKEEFAQAYLGHMLSAGLTEFVAMPDRYGVEAAERALQRISVTESHSLRKGMNMLATTGATAPFVGLVGTIFGIINAFQMMGEAGGGDLGAISSGIAEALITTAIGITVAIIGVWLFNYFNGKIDEITDDMSVSVQEFLDWCEKQIIPSAGSAE